MKIKRQIIAGFAVCLGLILGFGLIFAQGTLAANLPSANRTAGTTPIERSPDLVPITLPDWWDEEDQALAHFGQGVRAAGDVNNDGFDDVIVGALSFDQGGTVDNGGAWLYYGSANGLSVTHEVTLLPPVANTSGFFGFAVGTANVNGDEYDDILVAMSNFDSSYSDEGAVYVWYGSENGPGASYDWMARGNATYAHLGYDLGSAGDVNNDGYDDIIVGAWQYDTNHISHAYVWYGSVNGLNPDGSRPVGLPTNADWYAHAETNASGPGHGFGTRVGTAGDVNGDGYSDIFVGAGFYDNGEVNEGAVFVWYGSTNGLDPDGSRPVGTTANVDWWAESNQAGAALTGDPNDKGCGANTLGDVDGDGYDDFIVGSNLYNSGEGTAFLFYGSDNGLDPDGGRPIGNPDNADWLAGSHQAGAYLGFEFGEKGDFNDDGFDDVLISARYYDITGTPAVTNAGVGLIWYGSPQRYTEDGTPDNANVALSNNVVGEYLGYSIDWAGDINGDGEDDVIAGAPWHSNPENQEGRVYLFYGQENLILDLTAYNNSPTLIGDSTTLSATISAGTLVSYTWDFGDDMLSVGAVVSHTYPWWGTYTATVTAFNPVTTTYASTVVVVEPLNVYLPLIKKVVP